MSSLGVDCTALLELLRGAAETAGRLQAVLVSEHQAIVDKDIDILARCTEEKGTLAEQLENYHARRVAMLGGRESLEKAGWEALLTACGGAEGEVATAWQDFTAALEGCRRQNQINGKMLETNRRVVQQALNVLLGVPGDSTELYDQTGKAGQYAGSGQRSIKA